MLCFVDEISREVSQVRDWALYVCGDTIFFIKLTPSHEMAM